MSQLKENLVKSRSHFAFVIGISLAASFALSVETGVATGLRSSSESDLIVRSKEQILLAPISGLTRQDIAHAKLAWSYFERNYQPDTGLVNSVQNYPSTTIWDQASYLLGLISAQRIGIIDEEKFNSRMSQVLIALEKIPLFDGELPNKVYDTRTLEMTDYSNVMQARGIGWSALDVSRMAVPLNIILYDYPQHSAKAGNVISSWNFGRLVQDGQMFGARVDVDTFETELVQEGRLGYEEYGARALVLLGMDALSALSYDDYLRFETVSSQEIAVDSRSFSEFDAHNYVVSEPYILTALEFGFDSVSKELAYRIYQAQKNRFDETGHLTAVSEDNIDQAPYFLYNTVFANGVEWNPLAEDGTQHPEKRTLSTKAAFGWDAIYGTDYTAKLVDHVLRAQTQNEGWNSGVYEKSGYVNEVATANTNAIILEAIQYKANGPLITARFGKDRT